MSETPEWHHARPGTFWLVSGAKADGYSFDRCVAHVLDTANAPNRFQLCITRGSNEGDIVAPEEITEAVELTIVRKGHLDTLNRWAK